MAQQKIHLRKLRDFGENLGDTFQFIRQEFKPLLRNFLLIAGVFLLGAAIVTAIFQTEIAILFRDIDADGPGMRFVALLLTKYLVVLLCLMVAMAAMQTTVACYMKLYDQSGVSPSLEQVWEEFRKHIFTVLILALIKGILYLIGFALCILPGIYLMIVFAPMTFVVVNEHASVGTAFNRCFALSRQNFWLSTAIYIVAYIIYSAAGGILGFALSLITGIEELFSTHHVPGTIDTVVNSVSNTFSALFYIVFIVSVALNYYSLEEGAEGTGIMRRLESIGGSPVRQENEEEF
ncbi:MAG TPA: hypothetical protein VF145_06610 [Chitinophagaceae bacterium]